MPCYSRDPLWLLYEYLTRCDETYPDNVFTTTLQAECSTPAAAAAAAQALPHVTAQTPAAEVAPPVRKGDGWAPIKAE